MGKFFIAAGPLSPGGLRSRLGAGAVEVGRRSHRRAVNPNWRNFAGALVHQAAHSGSARGGGMKDEPDYVPLHNTIDAAPDRCAPAREGLVLRRVSDVPLEKISWLWPGRIARGKLTVIAGHPGLGKSQVTAWMAATVTTGRPWPGSDQRAAPSNVLILNAEDAVADTIRPRLIAAGAVE